MWLTIKKNLINQMKKKQIRKVVSKKLEYFIIQKYIKSKMKKYLIKMKQKN